MKVGQGLLLAGVAGVAALGVAVANEPRMPPATVSTVTVKASASPTLTVTPKASISSAAALRNVARVVDGDTVKLANGETVRLLGIDTPERGQCGYKEAADNLTKMIGGRPVTLAKGPVSDRDKYGRILRYIEVDGRDLNLAQITSGHAKAAYDSRSGYGRHPREAAYIAADAKTRHMCTVAATSPKPANPPGPYANCAAARAAGKTPLHKGDPGYSARLDGDRDGTACE